MSDTIVWTGGALALEFGFHILSAQTARSMLLCSLSAPAQLHTRQLQLHRIANAAPHRLSCRKLQLPQQALSKSAALHGLPTYGSAVPAPSGAKLRIVSTAAAAGAAGAGAQPAAPEGLFVKKVACKVFG